jgi:hypothetical protein
MGTRGAGLRPGPRVPVRPPAAPRRAPAGTCRFEQYLTSGAGGRLRRYYVDARAAPVRLVLVAANPMLDPDRADSWVRTRTVHVLEPADWEVMRGSPHFAMEEYLVITAAVRGRAKETRYAVARTAAGAAQAATVRLTKLVYAVDPRRPGATREWLATREVYDISLTEHGYVCDCADWQYSRDGVDAGGCKHIRSCIAQKLLPPREDARAGR